MWVDNLLRPFHQTDCVISQMAMPGIAISVRWTLHKAHRDHPSARDSMHSSILCIVVVVSILMIMNVRGLKNLRFHLIHQQLLIENVRQ